MDRILTPEEKIKRAEEIYARRNGNARPTIATVNVSEEKNYGLLKKMILQILICLLIYFIFYLIQNSNYVFSEDVLNKAKQILSYDIDLQGMYKSITENLNNYTLNQNDELNNVQTNEILEQTDETTIENAIGGIEIEENFLENNNQNQQENIENSEQNVEEKPQTDEEYIKANFSFIKPINGVVSSEFGLRNVDNPIVSKNHSGIDIAAPLGTVIKASMNGTVTVCSTQGDYGKHIKITNQDVSTLYAHCSKLYVKNGDVISQGQEIAEVGSTGNSTGPHLHFEIMRNANYINPRSILEF